VTSSLGHSRACGCRGSGSNRSSTKQTSRTIKIGCGHGASPLRTEHSQIDYLQSRSEVDPTRIGCVGLSWGGTHTMYAAALDKRFRVAVISGYFDCFKDMLIDAVCCPCQYIPNLLNYAELTDIMVLIASRPLLIENGLEDPFYTLEVVEQEYRKVECVYRLLDVPDRLDIDLFESAHGFSGRKGFDWVDRWL
jgi:dienelactone hydrolase